MKDFKKLIGTTVREFLNEINTYSNKDISGSEVIPNKFLYHVSNPIYREEIIRTGLLPKTGESYTLHVGSYYNKIIPAIFATNSNKVKDRFHSTYDDDVWEIDTTNLKNKWFVDTHYGENHQYILTFDPIPVKNLKLIYKGTGESQ